MQSVIQIPTGQQNERTIAVELRGVVQRIHTGTKHGLAIRATQCAEQLILMEQPPIAIAMEIHNVVKTIRMVAVIAGEVVVSGKRANDWFGVTIPLIFNTDCGSKVNNKFNLLFRKADRVVSPP